MKINKIIALVLLSIVLVACSNPKIRERFNLDYAVPNEFEVQKQRELVIPKKLELVKPVDSAVNTETRNQDISKPDQDFLNEIKY